MALNQQEHGSVAAAGVRRGDVGPAGVGAQAVPGGNQRPTLWSLAGRMALIIHDHPDAGPLMITQRLLGSTRCPFTRRGRPTGCTRPAPASDDRRPRDPRHHPHGQPAAAAPAAAPARVPALAVPDGPASPPTAARCCGRSCRCTSPASSPSGRPHQPGGDLAAGPGRQCSRECGGPGVGAIGMCLTSGFAWPWRWSRRCWPRSSASRACRPGDRPHAGCARPGCGRPGARSGAHCR